MATILYNFRKRGPYEYDKFILNTFQLHNEITNLISRIEETDGEAIQKARKEIKYIISDTINIAQELTVFQERI